MLAAAPLAVQYSQELRPYSLYLLLSVLSVYHLDCALGARPHGRAAQARARAALDGVRVGLGRRHADALLLRVPDLCASRLRGRPCLRWSGCGPGAELARTAGLRGRGRGRCRAGLSSALTAEHASSYASDFLGALVAAPATGGLVSDTGVAVHLATTLDADFFLRGVLPFFGGGEGLALAAFSAVVVLGLYAFARRQPARLVMACCGCCSRRAGHVYLQYRQQSFALRYILYALPIYLMVAAAPVCPRQRARPAVAARRRGALYWSRPGATACSSNSARGVH